MQKVTLTNIQKYTTNKDGTPLMGKNGKPYTRVQIRCAEYAERALSGFGGKETDNWQIGNSVEITVKENGQYLNFEVPKVADKLDMKYEELANKVTGITMRLNAIESVIKRVTTQLDMKPQTHLSLQVES